MGDVLVNVKDGFPVPEQLAAGSQKAESKKDSR
jgi:hypothetical protein